ncbi:hypothetical protein HY025_00665 [Candidatus Daviesbacteria bacterium]|nr:hypothetical protein [Candidatus Daviesbacteria bacterium]
MDQLAKILAIIHHFIWTVIGFVILILIIIYLIQGPDNFFKNFTSGNLIGSTSSTSSQSSSPTKSSGLLESKFEALTQSQKDCVKAAVGEARFSEVMSTGQVTKQDLQKANSCFK